MSRDELMYLQDIADSCERLLRYTSGWTKEQLIADEKTYDAVVRNLEILGEAAKHVSDELRSKIHDVQWRKIAGMRDLLAHAYFGIDNNILWDVVKNKVPHLLESVTAFLNEKHNGVE